MRLDAIPFGEALILQAEARATGLSVPVVTTGGSLVTTTPEAKPGAPPALAPSADQSAPPEPTLAERLPPTETLPTTPDVQSDAASPEAEPTLESSQADATAPALQPTATDLQAPAAPTASAKPAPTDDSGSARFTPGRATELRSRDGRIRVTFPADAFDRPLTLVHRTPTQQRALFARRGGSEPPETAGFYRGFGTFHLEATDDAGQQVKRFKQPLVLTVQFTPQQLQVLGTTAEALRLFWFDEARVVADAKGRERKGEWVPQVTLVDAEAGTASMQLSHFSAFQLTIRVFGVPSSARAVLPWPHDTTRPDHHHRAGQ
jgi:hypothetical protein